LHQRQNRPRDQQDAIVISQYGIRNEAELLDFTFQCGLELARPPRRWKVVVSVEVQPAG
jgi:hypothetical protein